MTTGTPKALSVELWHARMSSKLVDPPSALHAGIAASIGLDLPKRDPLRFNLMNSLAQRKVTEWVASGIECYWHAGNGSGKTRGLAALFLAMCRGWTRMDGRLLVRRGEEPDAFSTTPHWITLPGLVDGQPWRHWVLVNSYDQAKDSSLLAFRQLLGKHPHTLGWIDKAKGTVKLIRVKPDGWHSDEPSTWSEITFISQEGMTDEDVKFVQGARINSAQGDEMPKENVWREIRARRAANQRLYLGIGATPEFKHEWEWCLEDFAGCYDNPTRGRVRLQSSMRDNRALSLEDVKARVESYAGDSLEEARINGEHCDVSGACPFPHEPMDRLLAQCQPGLFETIEIRTAPTDPTAPDYRDILPASAKIERWLAFDPTHSYVITNDTSRGIDDDAHDPCEMQIWDWTEPALVCRFGHRKGRGGYLDEDSLAILADKLGREYGNALIDVEVAGSWGQQFILTLRKLRYPNIAHDDRTVSPGVTRKEYGWTASPTTNGEIVNALIKGLNEGSFHCWSRDVVSQWKDVREDSQGRPAKVAKGKRHHREAMICAGRALHWIQTRPAPRVMEKRREDSLAAALRKEFGREVIKRHSGQRRKRTEVFRSEVA